MPSDTRVAPRMHGEELNFGPAAIAMFVFLGLCAIVSLVGDRETADVAGFIGVFMGSAITGVLFIRRSRLFSGRERHGWFLVGVGLLLAASGVLSVAVIFLVVGDAPAFGINDLFFFATYITIIAGFAVLPHTHGSPLQRTRMAIDGLIGAVFVGSLLWVYLGSSLANNLEGAPTSVRTIGFIYPFFDLLFITVAVLVLLRRSTRRFDTRIALFTAGVAAQVIGDVLFLASAHAGSFDEATPPFALNILGISAFFAAAYLLKSAPAARQYADRDTPLWISVAAYLPAVGMLVVFTADAVNSSSPNLVLLISTVVVGLLVIARQGVAIAENRVHIEEQRNALVSTISHELRTPLTAITGFVDLLREHEPAIGDEEDQEMLEIVYQQTRYMARIVSDLIMLAKDTDSEIDLDLREVSMLELVSAAINASGLPAASVEVRCSEDLYGFVDPERLQQVLVNLLTNVARYGGANALVRVEAAGSDLVLEVHDDGPGIPRRYELRVWERFERGPNRLNAVTPGSGIGLAIVQAIAGAHGGTAAYRTSEALGGACFSVDLPGRAIAEVPSTSPSIASQALPVGRLA